MTTSGRTCTDSPQPTSGVIKNAGYCAGFCASGQTQSLLSYAQLATDPQANDQQITPVKGQSGVIDFAIDVDRASIVSPSSCASGSAIAPLGTSFLLVGDSSEPVWVHATATWQCNGKQLITSLGHREPY